MTRLKSCFAMRPSGLSANKKRETRSAKRITFLLLALLISFSGCGYQTAGRAARLPADLHTVAIPVFRNTTNSYRIEQVMTEAVVREFLARTRYRVLTVNDPAADALLRGTVTGISSSPVTYDSSTGAVSTVLVTLSLSVSLQDRQGKTLYSNTGYVFRQQYQVSSDPSSFFPEESTAVERISRDFARTLVADVLEAF